MLDLDQQMFNPLHQLMQHPMLVWCFSHCKDQHKDQCSKNQTEPLLDQYSICTPFRYAPSIDLARGMPSLQRGLCDELRSSTRHALELVVACVLVFGIAILVTLPAIHAIEIAYASLFHPTRVQGAPVPAPNGHPREGTTSTLIPSREQNSDDPDQSTTGDDTFATYLPAVQNAETATTGLVRAVQVTTATLYLSTDLGSDILEVDVATGTATLYFDASDVGILSQDVNALHLETDGSLLFSLAKPKSLPGITGFVDDSDVVRFVPTSLGDTTAGTFELYLDGSDVGLSTNGEDIDALGRAPDGRLVISLLGSYAVTGLSGDEEDLLVFNETSLGDTTAVLGSAISMARMWGSAMIAMKMSRAAGSTPPAARSI